MKRQKEAVADSSRPERKSARTRARLINCAISVFSRKGVDSAAISEIAQEAGVANGTFYIYFRDKAEIVAAMVDHLMSELFRRIHESMEPGWSAATRVSFATRAFILLATHEREWGFTMFRALASVPGLRHSAADHVLPMLKEGVATGEFATLADHFLGNLIATMNMMAVFSCLKEGEDPIALGVRLAGYQLRLLGVPIPQAAEICGGSLDRLKLDPVLCS